MSNLVLITGTSSGIGLATAVECAAAGHRVVATLRNLDKRETLEKAAKERGVKIDVEHLDVTHEGAGAKVRELVLKYGPFYALVNNAGIAVGGAFEEQSEEDVREQFETNVFGLMAVTRAVLPAMRAAGRGRIINVSSVSGRIAFPLLSVYAATKHAIEGFAEGLRWEVEPFGIQVLNVEPGVVKTPIFYENQRRGALVSSEGPYAQLNDIVERTLRADAEKGAPPHVVGATIVRLLSDPSPPFRTIVGSEARALVTLRRLLPDRLFSIGMRQALRGKPG
jgi:NAD(P)-dependent dehydrogenase (short-subunit alcohol dehydrogenase family)